MSPSATAVEAQIIAWMCGLAGFGAGSGGTFTSGGTEATLTALLAARAAALPGSWENGVDSQEQTVVLYGEHAHYAVGRAVAELGLGRRRGIPIPSIDYKMDVNALTARIGQLEHDGKKIIASIPPARRTGPARPGSGIRADEASCVRAEPTASSYGWPSSVMEDWAWDSSTTTSVPQRPSSIMRSARRPIRGDS
ncbi:MAG: pyridoxal-dependent decarboxylase [Gemmatimonadaceae bacterium]